MQYTALCISLAPILNCTAWEVMHAPLAWVKTARAWQRVQAAARAE